MIFTLRAKGTLISEPRFSTPLRDAIFPTRERENGLCRGFFFQKAIFPFSRGKNRISQGGENRGSLISVPLALRVARNFLGRMGVFFCFSRVFMHSGGRENPWSFSRFSLVKQSNQGKEGQGNSFPDNKMKMCV